MKATLYMAMSLNGYVSDSDGGEDFLDDLNWVTFTKFVEEYGNFIIGRKTYEAV